MEGGREQNFWPGFVDALSNVVLVMIFVVVVFVVTLFYYSQKLAQTKVSQLISQTQSHNQREVKASRKDVAAAERSGAERQNENAPTNASSASSAANNAASSAAETPGEREKAKEIEQLKREVATLKAKLAAPPLQSDNGSLRSSAAPSSPNAIQVKTEPNDKEVAPGLRIDANEKAVTLNFDADSTQLNEEGGKALDKSIGDWVRRVKSSQGKIVVTGVIGSGSYSESRRRAYYRTVAVRNYLIDAGVDKERVTSRVATDQNGSGNDARVVVQYQASAK
ncbi:OmpA family protein [Herbaspirillum sp. AP02]|uniref:OmpA family protein n=1 Tax=unclassified Herbaspirillum TaxID=2624150 RepID=UPI0015DA0888|nr:MULTISPECIES: OmpA family protein [unclassified Herbaspirillum]MBG7618660.1 OmpA family protein [Herbaspirillum sp. AP02]NZD67538.1 OmpA family protein [Herbaspirillum sp. AP21]